MKKTKQKEVKVNLGCGTSMVEGYINIDFVRPANADKSFLQADILNLPLESNSVDYIICDQVLEHIDMKDVSVALYNIRRVLKVGGRAVIIVPDFEDAVRQWLDARMNIGFTPIKYQWFSEVIYGNQTHAGEYHKTPMCAAYLHYVLDMVGLTKHEISFHPAFGKIPMFPGIRAGYENATLRGAELVADITKTL